MPAVRSHPIVVAGAGVSTPSGSGGSVADTRYAWQRGLSWYAANTGPRTARTTTISTSWVSSADNQIVTATKFTTSVEVRHHGVQFIDCEFQHTVYDDYTQHYYPSFRYCIMNANGQINTDDVPALPEGTIDHCNLYRINKGLQIRGSCTVLDSWFHDAVPYASPANSNHRETVITNGQDADSVVLIQRCWLDPIENSDVLSTGEALSGAMQLFNDFNPCHHWTVDGCYLGCGNTTDKGSYTTRWGYKLNNGTDPHHIVVTNNYIWPSQFGLVDGWFRVASNIWLNNVNAQNLSTIAEPATHLMF